MGEGCRHTRAVAATPVSGTETYRDRKEGQHPAGTSTYERRSQVAWQGHGYPRERLTT